MGQFLSMNAALLTSALSSPSFQLTTAVNTHLDISLVPWNKSCLCW